MPAFYTHYSPQLWRGIFGFQFKKVPELKFYGNYLSARLHFFPSKQCILRNVRLHPRQFGGKNFE